MTRARILADYVSSGDELALKAPLAGPTFTGTVAIPNVANLETAVVANTAKVTNYNQTLADINALDITELGTVTSGNLENTAIVYPAGHIIQRVQATLTNLTTTELTSLTGVADCIGQITIKSGNGVLIYWTTRITITSTTSGTTNHLAKVAVCEGTVASIGTILKAHFFGTHGAGGTADGSYHSPGIWVYDSTPADTTPDYVLTTEKQSSNTLNVASYGTPENACMLFEVAQ
jgi:hypothetical protein